MFVTGLALGERASTNLVLFLCHLSSRSIAGHEDMGRLGKGLQAWDWIGHLLYWFGGANLYQYGVFLEIFEL